MADACSSTCAARTSSNRRDSSSMSKSAPLLPSAPAPSHMLQAAGRWQACSSFPTPTRASQRHTVSAATHGRN
eukprot:CAMPEP_0206172688 /NCGR_PEP_ID=MMETSP1474-20131121/46391_1 /ASSEMBLY_ACC=CAM_ASM_001110 /TAXON_ID=97495 /ORGANISM="Imantonia sp., Strain RCC918" /LENGTH=72 /DNA_ID=CAMNT_0053580995 /DNA_START=104 /DNA_END=319 /DNA_ORIENTATION=-